jgi:hypothetical protein
MRKQRRRKRRRRSAIEKEPPSLPASVFINCPFDNEYLLLFEAMIFAVTCCGFLPRSALESGDVAELRIHRILRAMFASKYSIHELSRCYGEGDQNLARFNMPLELGMAMARRFEATENHDWFALVPEGHKHQKFISDLSGYDPKGHDGSLEDIVRKVMAWLVMRQEVALSFTPSEVLAKLPAFQEAVRKLREDWGDDLPWAYLISAAKKVAEQLLT